jgi:hypothetical protein
MEKNKLSLKYSVRNFNNSTKKSEEIEKTANFETLKSHDFKKRLFFLVDILDDLNKVNLKLQGKKNYIGSLIDIISDYENLIKSQIEALNKGRTEDFENFH